MLEQFKLVEKIENLENKYAEDEITVEELVKGLKDNYKKFIESSIAMYPNEDKYADDMTAITFKIKRLSEVMEFRKFKTHKQDALVMVEFLREVVSELEDLYKEE